MVHLVLPWHIFKTLSIWDAQLETIQMWLLEFPLVWIPSCCSLLKLVVSANPVSGAAEIQVLRVTYNCILVKFQVLSRNLKSFFMEKKLLKIS